MKHLSILIPEGILILDTIVGSMNLFRMANSYAKRIGKYEENYFYIDLVAEKKEPISCHRYFHVQPTATLKEIDETDLIIISSITGDLEAALEKNGELINWIRDQRVKNDAEVVSLCRSAFILAETGLLNGKSCATHWVVHEHFQRKYPKIELLPEKIISEDKGIYSSGGAYSFLNMILYLIEKYYGGKPLSGVPKWERLNLTASTKTNLSYSMGKKSMEMS